MIELYDTTRLTIKHDRSLPLAAGVLALTAGLMAAYTAFLHLQLNQTLQHTQVLQGQLAALGTPARGETTKASASPRAALVADLQLQAEQLEREVAQAGLPISTTQGPAADSALKPSQWMTVLAALTQTETSLQKVDVESSGAVRLEGLATSPQALNELVQAWEKQDAVAFVQARSINVKQEKGPPPLLRFQLQGTPVPAARPAGAPERPASAPAGSASPPAPVQP